MKGLLVALAVLTLAGCASDWKGYSDANHCQATEKTLRKPVANSFSTSTPNPGAFTLASPSMELRYEPYRLYKCDNGPIWGPITVDGKE